MLNKDWQLTLKYMPVVWHATKCFSLIVIKTHTHTHLIICIWNKGDHAYSGHDFADIAVSNIVNILVAADML